MWVIQVVCEHDGGSWYWKYLIAKDSTFGTVGGVKNTLIADEAMVFKEKDKLVLEMCSQHFKEKIAAYQILKAAYVRCEMRNERLLVYGPGR